MLLANLLNDFGMIGEMLKQSYEYPRVQLYSNKENLLLLFEVPGFSEGELDVSLTDDVVTISGKKEKFDPESKDLRVLRSEIPSGDFTRRVELPFEVRGGEVKATLKDGILSLTMPIKEKDKPKTIQIQGE